MLSKFKSNRKLGVAKDKTRYDLPLNQSSGTHFLVLLVALMTFLAFMAITATLFLNDVTDHWSSGLENKLTIEIPALKKDGKTRDALKIKTLSDTAASLLKQNPNVQSFEVMGEESIQELISPWLGDDISLNDIPLPGLISVHLHIRDKDKLKQLSDSLQTIAPDIRLDTHEEWLADIIRLASTLKLSSLIVTLIIGLTTITAIAGAVRSRMAEHKADIELLHLMGASDVYITNQLQRHAVFLTLKGSLFGAGAGLCLLLLFWATGGQSNNDTLPQLSLSTAQILILPLLPAAISVIASQATRFTVLRVLGDMP